jgi:hypothetical protein
MLFIDYMLSVGMQQNHSRVPWQANLKDDVGKQQKMHLQGVLSHGETIDMYPTFCNTELVSDMSLLYC